MISVLSIFLIAWVLPAVFGFGAPRVEAPRGGLVSSRSALFASEPAAKASRAAAAKTDKVPLRSTTQSLLKTMPSQIVCFFSISLLCCLVLPSLDAILLTVAQVHR